MRYRDRIPQAALARFDELRDEERDMQRTGLWQIGTTTPRSFTAADTFILNPSNVGTGMLARMNQTDDTVSCANTFGNLMMLSKIGKYHHKNNEISDFVNDFLEKLKGPTWPESLEAQASANTYGFSATEVCSGLDKMLRRVPIRLATYHPSTLAFEVDEFGQITPMGVIQFVYQYSQWRNPNATWPQVQYGWKTKNPFETPTDRLVPWRFPFFAEYGLARIPRQKVIHHAAGSMDSFGSPYGNTRTRTMHLAWQLKVFVMKQAGIAVKRSAQPTTWVSAPQGGQKVEYEDPDTGKKRMLSPREAMQEIMKDRESDDAVVTGSEKEGYGAQALQNTADLEEIGGLLDRLDVRIFRCRLLPSLVMTDGTAGSRSLGDKHFQIVDYIAGEDARKFSKNIINDMIEPVIRDNFGSQDDYGEFKSRPQSIEERERLANMYNGLTTSQIIKPYVKDEMKWIRETLSLPEDTDTSFEVKPPGEGEPGADPGAEPRNDRDRTGKAPAGKDSDKPAEE